MEGSTSASSLVFRGVKAHVLRAAFVEINKAQSVVRRHSEYVGTANKARVLGTKDANIPDTKGTGSLADGSYDSDATELADASPLSLVNTGPNHQVSENTHLPTSTSVTTTTTTQVRRTVSLPPNLAKPAAPPFRPGRAPVVMPALRNGDDDDPFDRPQARPERNRTARTGIFAPGTPTRVLHWRAEEVSPSPPPGGRKSLRNVSTELQSETPSTAAASMAKKMDMHDTESKSESETQTEIDGDTETQGQAADL